MAMGYKETPLEEHQNTNGVLTPNQLQEEDLWIEMPPRSVEDVVMKVEYMGRAKPLDFGLDDVLADSDGCVK